MTSDDDLQAIAQRIVAAMVKDHPDEAAVLASFVLSEILSIGLFGGDESEITAFAAACPCTPLFNTATLHSPVPFPACRAHHRQGASSLGGGQHQPLARSSR